jgi:hypothetical protein
MAAVLTVVQILAREALAIQLLLAQIEVVTEAQE